MATVPKRSSALKVVVVLAALGAAFTLFLVSSIGAILGTSKRPGNSFAPSDAALADIPEDYLRIYQAVGAEFDLDWTILAGIGKVETNHGRLDAPGVTSGVNTFGCCAGPMQFNLRNGPPSTWESYRDSAGDDVYDPADAIPASARLLIDNGAPDSYRQAIFAYNHAHWYVEDVMAQAERYRGAAARASGAVGSANASEILNNDRVTMTGVMRAQLEQGDIDPRIIATIAFAADDRAIIITSLLRPGDPRNHGAGRAVDIGAVDGDICTGTRTGKCGQLAVDLARVEGDARSTELIYAFDADGAGDPRGFADPVGHSDHIHVGFDK